MSIKSKQLFWFFAFFLIYELNIYLSNDMIMPAMLIIIDEFKAEQKFIPLSLSLYLLGGSSMQIFLGPLADYIGKRKLILTGNALFLLATLMVPFSTSIEQFLITRFFQGMGCCFVFVGYAMIHELFDDIEAVKLSSILSSTTILAPLAGPIIGSAIINRLDWKYVFFMSGALGLISLIGLFKFMPKNEVTLRFLDLGAIRRSYAKIFSNRRFMFGIFTAGLATAPLTAWIGFSPIFVMQDMRASYDTYIILQCTILSGFVLSSIAIQKLKNDFPLVHLLRMGGLIAAAGMLGAGAGRHYIDVFAACMFVYSIGFGLFNGALIRCSLTSSKESLTLTSAAMSLLYCIYLAAWLQLYNVLCQRFGYSLSTYALLNIPVILTIVAFLLIFSRGMATRGNSAALLAQH
ncbi:MFS transporter [Janthinobacterium sp.]|uniref:MFS transporter n=1 Tax=Janthinobacterium sp. TaxID=1871054 RepID=UPI00293D5D2C|nr:MFS transporter [Janthinobacterium sp.]